MWGVEAAVLFLTCSVSLIVLLTAPWWIRILSALVSHVSTEFKEVDRQGDPETVYPREEK